MKLLQLAALAACLCAISAGYLPEKLVKKYAMKKIAEDCFGEDVMSDLKQEMYAAHVKCSGHHPDALPAADALIAGDDVILTRRRREAHGRHFSAAKLQKLRSKITNFVGNATCVFRELKMLDQDNNVDLTSMKERLSEMDVDDGLKKDLEESLDVCHQWATCLPDSAVAQPAVLMGFSRQMFFFKCFKEAKLESCMKKTFREDYLPMLVEENMPASEDESFYTILAAAVVGDKKHGF